MDGPITTIEPPAAPSAPIDPRIRARRIEVRRVEGRRRLQRAVDLAMLAAVGLGFLGALWTPLLDVDEIRVQGARQTPVAAVVERSGLATGDALIGVDVGAVGRRVAALPWAESVSVRRGVDGVVAIDVTERTAVAVVRSGAEGLLVDRDGRVLGPMTGVAGPTSVIELTGVGSVPAPGDYLPDGLADALRVAERLALLAPGAVSSLDAEGLTGRLVAGGTVRFGDASRIDTKVRSLRTVLDQVDLSCLALLDLRLPGTPVLTREQGCS